MQAARPSLTLVPTPIGNLEDITMRALNVLKSVDTILAEDTRTSSVLLRHYGIEKKLQPYHIFNEHRTLGGLIERMKQGETMALVSDAGTPGIADPGFLLVRECLKNGIWVDCLPGPTALIPALVQSGFPMDAFVFLGFLPHKKGKQTAIQTIAAETRTVIFYESPHRLLKTLEMLMSVAGEERPVSVSRELTKMFQETKTGGLRQVFDYFSAKEIKGEIVVVVHGRE